MAADRADAASWVGREISHYRVIDRLGSGGMGEVYRAEDTRLGRVVALKRLKPEFTNDAAARRRFEAEARAVARLSHTHITTVFDFDAEAGFLTLELVEGYSLEESLAGGALAPAEVVRIVAAVARALEHAHARNVIHRDIKPSNILLDDSGTVKLTDFGLARVRDDAGRSTTGMVLGTAAYMSPEQIRGRGVDRQSDLFSLGVVLYRGLTGRLPWNGDGLAILYSILHDHPPPLDAIAPGTAGASLAALVDRLLRKDPKERFEAAAEVARDLEALRPELTAGATAPGRAAPTGPGPSGRPTPLPDATTGDSVLFPADEEMPTRRRLTVPLLGRRAELRQLLDTLEVVRFGGGRTLLIEGEAGLGKTRLIEELAAAARATGVLTLSGRCAYQEGRYFGPFVEALEELSRRDRDEPTGSREVGGGPDIRGALDLLVQPVGAAAAEPRSREQLWILVDSLLKSLARETPLLLCLEDLHWADEGTLSLLHHLARNIGQTRMMLVGAFRPEELLREGGVESPFVDLLRVLSNIETVERMALPRLDEAGTLELVSAALPGLPLARELAPSIHRRSQGNPLFTLEILRYLEGAASGSVLPRGLADSMALPPTISDVLLRRLMRLSQDDRDLLELAAVEGDTFDLDMLAAGSGLPRMALLRQLRGLAQKHQLIEALAEGYRFSHQLVREVLLREMPADLRREYHAIVADLHLDRYGDRLDVAGRAGYHLYEAGRLVEAVPHLARAADNARRLFLYDKALMLVDQAVDAMTRGGVPGASSIETAARLSRFHRQRCDLLLLVGRPDEAGGAAELAWSFAEESGDPLDRAAAEERQGEVALARGDHGAASLHLESAESHYASAGDRAETTRCRQRLGTLACRRGEYPRALELLGEAHEAWIALGDATATAGAELELGEVAALTGDVGGAEELFRRAIAVFREAGDRSGLARGLLLSANLNFQSGDTSQSLERYHEAIALTTEIGDIQSGARCMANLGNVFLVRGDPEQALTSYRAARARFEEIGDQRGAATAIVAEGNVDYSLGRFAEAAALWSRAVPVRTAMEDRWGLANVLDNMSVAEYYLGRWAEALQHARSGLAIREQLGDRPGRAESCLNLANLLAVLGEERPAAERYAEAEALATAVGNRRKLAAAWLAQACVALWGGRGEQVRELVDRVEALGLEEPVLQVKARVCLALSHLEVDPDAAVTLLREAVDRAASAASFPEQMLAEFGLVTALGRSGRRDEAERLLRQGDERLAERPIPLLQLESVRASRELASGTEPDDVAAEREQRLLDRLSANLPEGWRAAPRYVRRAFPIP